MRIFLLIAFCAMPSIALTAGLAAPTGGELVTELKAEPGQHLLPLAPFQDDWLPTRVVKGAVSREVWRIEQTEPTTNAVMSELRQRILAAGLSIQLDCVDELCGGFDFRFETEVLPAPDMYVDLSDFRFLSALGEDTDDLRAVSILVSRTSTAVLIQMISVRAISDVVDVSENPVTTEPLTTQNQEGEIASQLTIFGHAVLQDLAFEAGLTTLRVEPYQSLTEIAAYLKEHKTARVALVGHTDSVGAFDDNIALSKKRAEAVMEQLVTDYGVNTTQLEARGAGYLSPVASNTTDQGRAENRRVEAVLLP
jgi:OOP family OmpA-OmpF porin